MPDILSPDEELRQRTLGGMLSGLPDVAPPPNPQTLGGGVQTGPASQRVMDLQNQLAQKKPATGVKGFLGNLASSIPLGRMVEAAVPNSRQNLEMQISYAQPAATTEQNQAAASVKQRQENALATEEEAKAQAALNPVAKPTPEEQAFQGAIASGMSPLDAYRAVQKQPTSTDHVAPGEMVKQEDGTWQQVGTPKPSGAEGERQLTDAEVQQLNAALTDRYAVLNPGKPLPPEYKLNAGATQKDYDRLDKSLGATENAVSTKTQRDITNQNASEKLTQQQSEQRSKDIKPYQGKIDSAANAEDYVNSGNHTGPGDEALMLQFFNTVKPETGFRLTQTEQKMLLDAQSWVNSFKAKVAHITGGTWMSDEQRQQIVKTMQDFAGRAQQQIDQYDAKQKGGKGSHASTGQLTRDEAMQYLQRAGGDKDKARQLAKQDGRSF